MSEKINVLVYSFKNMVPLSEKLRPKNLTDVVGQKKIIQFVERVIQSKKPVSFILFGPPGSGKTTIARIYAESFKLPFLLLSAVINSTLELKKMLKEGNENPLFHRQTVVFVDEIHRFNRAQQDIFLPFLEDGSLILIGSTTENPSFCLNNALLSRLRVLKMDSLEREDLEKIIERFEKYEHKLNLTHDQKTLLINHSSGDARHLLNMIEGLNAGLEVDKKPPLYDRDQDSHFNLISALHKSVRGSDPNAALYWLCRMLEGGEDPLYIGRRLIRMASEDIGLADPNALQFVIACYNAYQMLGSPEGELSFAQAVIYLSLAPKSNASYIAYNLAKEKAQDTNHLDPPPHILNAPTKLMKDLGYGKGYIYDPDTESGVANQEYFPLKMEKESFYHPFERGFEREMKKRLEYFQNLRTKASSSI